MSMPEIVSQDEWTIAREAMGDKKQAAAESRLELAAERRRMPMIRIDKEYRFERPDGQVTLGVGNAWSLLELTPFGRQQEDEDSPEGWPQDPRYSWYRRHDEYDGSR